MLNQCNFQNNVKTSNKSIYMYSCIFARGFKVFGQGLSSEFSSLVFCQHFAFYNALETQEKYKYNGKIENTLPRRA